MLSIRAVRIQQGSSFTLECPAIDFRPGEVFGVLGPNGAGKSTLLGVLAGQRRGHADDVAWEGVSRGRMGARIWARHVAFVAQETTPPPFTVRQFVGLGRYPFHGLLQKRLDEDDSAIDAALARCGVADLADTQLAALSGGQRQRARIAHALAQEPDVLLLDEPTNHLDLLAIRDTVVLLRELTATGMSLIVSLHDLDLAGVITDRVAILERGGVQRIGPTAHVLNATSIRRHWGVNTIQVPDRSRQRFLLDHAPADRGELWDELGQDIHEPLALELLEVLRP